MSTTCQDIVTRAEQFSALNAALTDDRAEMLSRIRADQQALFTAASHVARDRFKTTVSVTSTAAASNRVISLSGLALPMERVLRLQLSTGADVNQVDELDPEAEFAPRYFVRGLSLVEVDDDWNTASSAAQTLTLTYVYGPTDIDPTGAYTQAVTVPDAWADLLVLPLGMYLHTKDPGRDPAEYEKLAKLLDERTQAWLAYLRGFGGVESRRFDVPSPLTGSKKQ